MILVSLTMTQVGPFTGTVTVGPLTRGLNVLAAYNEEGKTTLVRAATRALFDRHTGKSDEIRQLQPVGTNLAPSICVVFETGGTQYRIEKVFLESSKSRLSKSSGGTWQLLADGDAADNRLCALLHSEQPGRGATKPEHWGLFQYLWARQGEPAAWPNWDGEAGKMVRARLVRIELDPVIEQIRAALDADYTELFTDTGRAKARGPLDLAEGELIKYETELQLVQQKTREIETTEAQYHQTIARITTVEAEANEKRRQAEEIAEAARKAEVLSVELESKKKDLDTARDNLRSIEEDIKTLARLRQSVTDLQSGIGETKTINDRLDREIADLERRFKEADTTAQRKQKARGELQHKLDDAQAFLKYRRITDQLAELESRLTIAKRKGDELKSFEQQRAKLPMLTDRKLRSLRELDSEISRLNAQIEVIGIAIEVTPDKTQKIHVKESRQIRSLTIGPGNTETIKSGQSVELRLESWGRVCVRSGAAELADLQKQRHGKARELKSTITELGVKSVDEAVALLEQRKELDGKFHEAERDIKNVLSGYDDIPSLQIEVDQQRVLSNNLETAVRLASKGSQASLSDLDAESERLRVEIKQTDGRIKMAQDDARQSQNDLADRREEHHSAGTNLARFQERLNNAQNHIHQIELRFSQGLDATKKTAQQQFSEAEARVEAVRAKLPPDADKLPERNRRAARAAQEAVETLQTLRTERDKLSGTLQALGAQGVYSRETELLEAISAKKSEADAARRRGWAARLLRDLLVRRKQATMRSVLAPLQQQISTTFADLTADRARKVFLDQELQIRGVGNSEHELIPFEILSQGAKEQLLLALRLAVATATADNEPQLLVLDDVLVNTDPIRQQRVLDLLQSAAEHLQLLVLTCHVDRYRGIGHSFKIEPQTNQPHS